MKSSHKPQVPTLISLSSWISFIRVGCVWKQTIRKQHFAAPICFCPGCAQFTFSCLWRLGHIPIRGKSSQHFDGTFVLLSFVWKQYCRSNKQSLNRTCFNLHKLLHLASAIPHMNSILSFCQLSYFRCFETPFCPSNYLLLWFSTVSSVPSLILLNTFFPNESVAFVWDQNYKSECFCTYHKSTVMFEMMSAQVTYPLYVISDRMSFSIVVCCTYNHTGIFTITHVGLFSVRGLCVVQWM